MVSHLPALLFIPWPFLTVAEILVHSRSPETRPLISYSAMIYIMVVIGWFLFRISFGDDFWWLKTLTYISILLFVPLPFLIVAEMVAHKRKFGMVLLIPFAILLWTQWPYFVPIFPSSPTEHNLRVMTYNVLKTNHDYDAVAKVIRSVDPDLVALQEVDEGLMLALQSEFSDLYPYNAVAQLPDWQWNTTVVFSRYPFVASETLDLEEIRPAMLVRVKVGEKPLTFISAHLYYYYWWNKPWRTIPSLMQERTVAQNRQTEILLKQIAHEPNDVILACDCNSKLTQSSYKMFLQQLQSAQRVIAGRFHQPPIAGTQFDRDLFNVDHILFNGTLKPVGAYSVNDAGGSDHRAMIADFIF